MDPIQHFYKELEEEGQEKSRHFTRPPVRFRASEVADCARKIAYRLAGHKPAPRTPELAMYGYQGDADHDLARQLLQHYGVQLGGLLFKEDGEIEEEMWNRGEVFHVIDKNGIRVEVMITARADGKIFLEDRKEWALLEIKGQGFWPFDWLKKTFEKSGLEGALERIKVKHRSYYWQCTVTAKLHGLERIYLLVKDRSGSQLGIVNDTTGERHGGCEWDVDQELWEEILKKLANIKRHVDEGTLPPTEYAAGSKECSWCSFKYLCHDAVRRRQQGKEPAVVFPGPETETHEEETTDADST